MKKGKSTLEISSIENIFQETIKDYEVSTYSVNNVIRGLGFYANDNYYEVEVWSFEKAWEWNIFLREPPRWLGIFYNGFKKNRIDRIMISDDSLRCGMAISMTFRSLKKLWQLETFYAETIHTDKGDLRRQLSIDNSYHYIYRKNGKLKSWAANGEPKVCTCE
ncbi:MAG: hypothetical protein ABI480_10035 [Chitinophagaceae bacterium]